MPLYTVIRNRLTAAGSASCILTGIEFRRKQTKMRSNMRSNLRLYNVQSWPLWGRGHGKYFNALPASHWHDQNPPRPSSGEERCQPSGSARANMAPTNLPVSGGAWGYEAGDASCRSHYFESRGWPSSRNLLRKRYRRSHVVYQYSSLLQTEPL